MKKDLRFLRNLMTTCMLLFFAGMSAAQTGGNYLHVNTGSGWKVIDIDKVDKLTFTGGNMTAVDSENKTVESIPLNSLVAMVYSEDAKAPETSSVAIVEGNAKNGFHFDAASSIVTMQVAGNFEVFAASGELLVNIPEVKVGETIDLSAVKSGVVIMKTGDYTLKTILK